MNYESARREMPQFYPYSIQELSAWAVKESATNPSSRLQSTWDAVWFDVLVDRPKVFNYDLSSLWKQLTLETNGSFMHVLGSGIPNEDFCSFLQMLNPAMISFVDLTAFETYGTSSVRLTTPHTFVTADMLYYVSTLRPDQKHHFILSGIDSIIISNSHYHFALASAMDQALLPSALVFEVNSEIRDFFQRKNFLGNDYNQLQLGNTYKTYADPMIYQKK